MRKQTALVSPRVAIGAGFPSGGHRIYQRPRPLAPEPTLPLELLSRESLQPERGNTALLHQGKACSPHETALSGPLTVISKNEAGTWEPRVLLGRALLPPAPSSSGQQSFLSMCVSGSSCETLLFQALWGGWDSQTFLLLPDLHL